MSHVPSNKWSLFLSTFSNTLPQFLNNSWFQNFTKLLELRLTHNRIKHVNERSILGLRHLQKLIVSSNEIEQRVGQIFIPLINLKLLSMANNRIVHIDCSVFHGLHQLESLNLEANRLHHIKHIFHHVNSLKKLDISMNPIPLIHGTAFSKLKK